MSALSTRHEQSSDARQREEGERGWGERGGMWRGGERRGGGGGGGGDGVPSPQKWRSIQSLPAHLLL